MRFKVPTNALATCDGTLPQRKSGWTSKPYGSFPARRSSLRSAGMR